MLYMYSKEKVSLSAQLGLRLHMIVVGSRVFIIVGRLFVIESVRRDA